MRVKSLVVVAVIAVAISVAFVSATPGTTPGQGQNPPGNFPWAPSYVVVDSTGAVVGDLIDAGNTNQATVAIPMGPTFAPVFVAKTQFRSFGTSWLYFENPGCVGPPYLEFRSSPLPMTFVTSFVGNTLFVETGAPQRRIFARSRHNETGVCRGIGFSRTVVPAEEVAVLNDLFTPPFSVVRQ